jgi:hypothetical protein
VLRVLQTWVVGEYTIREVEFKHSGERGYDFQLAGSKPNNEVFATLDHALASAIAARWTGFRGAAGSGVGTAADWFMRMLTPVVNDAPRPDGPRRGH